MKKKTRRLRLRSETLRTLNSEVEQAAGDGIVINTTILTVLANCATNLCGTVLCSGSPTDMTVCYICPVFVPEPVATH